MIKRIISIIFSFFLIGLLLLFNIRLHQPGDLETTVAQLNFIQQALDDGAGEQMQTIFPEGYVFTWALYGLSSAQVASQFSPEETLHAYYLKEAERAVRHVRSPQARRTFNEHLDPKYGAFYSSWSLYLLAQYIRAASPDHAAEDLVSAFKVACTQFSEALNRSNSPFLSSYAGASWPADTTVGIAALGLHDAIFQPKYSAAINNWIAKARALQDRNLRAISHSADFYTGEPIGGVRGSSLALMSRVLIDADPKFAAEQYVVLREHFVDYRWGVPGVREYPHDVSGSGDVDSGPLILGFSGPAIVVGAAAARVHGDESLATVLLGTVEAGGFPIQLGDSRSYAGGFVPVGDAFIAWSRSSPTPNMKEATSWKALIPSWWAIPTHLLSLIIGVLMIVRLIRRVTSASS